MLTEGFIAHVPGCPEPLHGREIWSRGTKMMKDAFPDLRIDVQDMFGVGDKVTALVRFQGTHRRGRVPAVRGDGARRCVPERRGLPLRG
ncbi:ester cyclase [Streptomyces sp. NPDC001568]|uniref:ester cyclase n=1 Tax=Streptomyces sp. NPDC001568 TaxID=3364588 RepID=UPI0036743702